MEHSGSLHTGNDGRAGTQSGGGKRAKVVPDPSIAKRNRRKADIKQFVTGTHRVGHPPEHGRLRALDIGKRDPTVGEPGDRRIRGKSVGFFGEREFSERCKHSTDRQRDAAQRNAHT